MDQRMVLIALIIILLIALFCASKGKINPKTFDPAIMHPAAL